MSSLQFKGLCNFSALREETTSLALTRRGNETGTEVARLCGTVQQGPWSRDCGSSTRESVVSALLIDSPDRRASTRALSRRYTIYVPQALLSGWWKWEERAKKGTLDCLSGKDHPPERD